MFDLREQRLRREEAEFEVVRRQQGEDRSAGRHSLARPIIDLLDGAVGRAVGVAAAETSLRPGQVGLGLPQHRFRIFIVLLRAGLGAHQFFRAIEILLRVDYGRLPHHQIRLLKIVVDGEQWLSLRDPVALAHLQLLDAALLVGADEDQLGLYPALHLALIGVVATSERKTGKHDCGHDGKFRLHGSPPGANNSSKWVFIILRTSSGSKRSKRPLQMMATRPGAAMICGKSASPAGISPRLAARCSSARIAAMMRESTSR